MFTVVVFFCCCCFQALSPAAVPFLLEDNEPEMVRHLRMKMLLLKTVDTENSEILTVGATLDDRVTVETYLKKFPNDVSSLHIKLVYHISCNLTFFLVLLKVQ